MTYCSRNASRVRAVDVAPEFSVDGVGDVVVGEVDPATNTVQTSGPQATQLCIFY